MNQIDFTRPAVRLSTGETIAADLIIGADGARSVCRDTLLGQPDPLQPSGYLTYRICIDINEVSQYPEVVDLIHPPRIHGWLGPAAHIVCSGLKGLFNVVLSQPEDREAISFDVQRGDLRKLRRSFENWEPRLQKLLEIAEETLRWSLPQSRQIESWVHTNGNFTLVGDSAHSTFPLMLAYMS